ncbi:MAG: right-handed parallel beta-helix repeat-containing protein, partial [Candidatus Thermoplasmatota archaeon]
MKKIIPALLILLILLSGLPPPALSESVRSPEIILYVGGSGPNNYTKIQDAINASQPGDRIYVYSGIYYERIVIDKTISLIGESRENTVIINWDERANIVSIVADGVHMNNFSIVGGMPAGNRGIHLVQFSNNIITNCAICNTSCGILIGSPSHSNQIINCTLHNNSYGIRIISSPNNKLRGNSLENNHYNLDVGEIYYQDIDRSNTINGRPVYYILEQANLVFNETMNIGYLGLVSCNNISVYNIELHNNVQGFLLVNTSYSTLTNCVCHDHSYSLCLLKSSNNQITDFVCYNSGGAGRGGMDIRHSSNNTLTNCTCYKNYGFRLSGIHLCNSCNNTLINCVCYHNAEDGIRLSQLSTNNNIINCSCYENNYGIELSSSNNKIMSCSCYGNYYGDILLDRSSSNIVTNCICKNAGGYGIELCYSSNCVLTHCQVSGTSKGIYLLGSGNNEIMSCSCYQNSYGLYLDKSPNNCITNCSFCNNNEDGLYLDKSPNNCITNCSFSNNHRGLSLFSSPGNRLRSNNLENNRCNLNINGEEISDYHQDITLSNTINGKPIYYLIEENSRVVDGIADIGYLGIVSCSNIT